ncbi:MAG: hypothetical protein ACO3Z6_15100, partial [Pseudomonadales bacterium]
VLCFSQAGCTFQSSQLDALVGLFGRHEGPDVFTWRGEMNGQTRSLALAEERGLFLFVASEGDVVSFDGWMIRSVVGFGQRQALGIRDFGERRRLGVAGRFTDHRCEQWLKVPVGARFQWVQECEGSTRYRNTIDLDERSQIVAIDQVVTPAGDRVSLRRSDAG